MDVRIDQMLAWKHTAPTRQPRPIKRVSRLFEADAGWITKPAMTKPVCVPYFLVLPFRLRFKNTFQLLQGTELQLERLPQMLGRRVNSRGDVG
jgi:hypothetical protein